MSQPEKRKRWAQEEAAGVARSDGGDADGTLPDGGVAGGEGEGCEGMTDGEREVAREVMRRSEAWQAACLLLDTLEEFGIHLVEAVWESKVGGWHH